MREKRLKIQLHEAVATGNFAANDNETLFLRKVYFSMFSTKRVVFVNSAAIELSNPLLKIKIMKPINLPILFCLIYNNYI